MQSAPFRPNRDGFQDIPGCYRTRGVVITHTVCWTQMTKGLVEGAVISLKGLPGRWTVEWVSKMTLRHPPRSDWKVGGLT